MAALRQGFNFPYNCQNAVCGTCMGRVLRGEVSYDNQAEEELSSEEKEEGFAFFCSAKPKTHLVIEMFHVEGPDIKLEKTSAYHVMGHTILSPNTLLLELYPENEKEALSFHAGQYLYLCYGDEYRAYSIANAEEDSQRIELHIRHTDDNAFANQMIALAEQKKILYLEGPHGHCVLHQTPALPTILLAAGTGFAQMKALIEEQLKTRQTTPLYLYWGARKREDLYAHELALEWAQQYPFIHYQAMLSAPEPGTWSGELGYIYEKVVKDHPDLSGYQVYASGPPDMVLAALQLFEQHALNRNRMYSDMLFDP